MRLAVLLLGWQIFSDVIVAQSSITLPRSNIHVYPVSPFGHKIATGSVHLYTMDGKQDLARNVKGFDVSNVPYGSYFLVVTSSGGGIGQRLLTVNVKDLWVQIGIPMPRGDALWPGGDLAVRGKIVPEPKDLTPWWVRLDGIFLQATRESPLQRGGAFSVEGLEMGFYLLKVFEGSKLRHVQSIDVDPMKPLVDLRVSISHESQQ
jgi:hypothetical protein